MLVSDIWNRIDFNRARFRSAFITPFILGSIVFAVVFAVVGSVRVTMAVTLPVIMCTLSTFFVFVIFGWGIGMIEGLYATILVELNVDYTVHVDLLYLRS